MNKDSFILEIEWTKPDLPNRVGPFATRAEADEWARLNIPNGSWIVAPLSWPYYQRNRAGGQ